MKAFDKAYTKVIQDYAYEIIRYIAKQPKAETPMIMVAMSDIIRGLLESSSITKEQKTLYRSMKEYNENHFDAKVTINYESEDKDDE
jgi:hypothetical protein